AAPGRGDAKATLGSNLRRAASRRPGEPSRQRRNLQESTGARRRPPDASATATGADDNLFRVILNPLLFRTSPLCAPARCLGQMAVGVDRSMAALQSPLDRRPFILIFVPPLGVGLCKAQIAYVPISSPFPLH